jgi:hypothetical protein
MLRCAKFISLACSGALPGLPLALSLLRPQAQ